jgi:hypothetical protein
MSCLCAAHLDQSDDCSWRSAVQGCGSEHENDEVDGLDVAAVLMCGE